MALQDVDESETLVVGQERRAGSGSRHLFNSLVSALSVVILNLFITSAAAYRMSWIHHHDQTQHTILSGPPAWSPGRSRASSSPQAKRSLARLFRNRVVLVPLPDHLCGDVYVLPVVDDVGGF